MSKHTPGPWIVSRSLGGVFAENGSHVASTHGSVRNYDRDAQIAEQNANARLIAAAPEMLDLLRQASEHVPNSLYLDIRELIERIDQ